MVRQYQRHYLENKKGLIEVDEAQETSWLLRQATLPTVFSICCVG
jgi:hypothetical protein